MPKRRFELPVLDDDAAWSPSSSSAGDLFADEQVLYGDGVNIRLPPTRGHHADLEEDQWQESRWTHKTPIRWRYRLDFDE